MKKLAGDVPRPLHPVPRRNCCVQLLLTRNQNWPGASCPLLNVLVKVLLEKNEVGKLIFCSTGNGPCPDRPRLWNRGVPVADPVQAARLAVAVQMSRFVLACWNSASRAVVTFGWLRSLPRYMPVAWLPT